MSNVEHLFENALVALENDYDFGEWKRTQTDIHNADGVSEEVLEAIWELAIYTKYTYEPSLNAIPVEWIRNYVSIWVSEAYKNFVLNMITKWEKENDKGSE